MPINQGFAFACCCAYLLEMSQRDGRGPLPRPAKIRKFNRYLSGHVISQKKSPLAVKPRGFFSPLFTVAARITLCTFSLTMVSIASIGAPCLTSQPIAQKQHSFGNAGLDAPRPA
jgi:hypothetical protein